MSAHQGDCSLGTTPDRPAQTASGRTAAERMQAAHRSDVREAYQWLVSLMSDWSLHFNVYSATECFTYVISDYL